MADIEADAPTSGKRANTKAANRRAILTAARRVFALIGYEATTVRDIIREELQGALGERITRNVRKLVRAEIARAMAVRDFE